MLGDIFKFAVNNGDIPNNPLANVVVPKYDENHGEAITLDEEKHLIDFLIQSRDKCVQAYVFLIYTSMRIGKLATAKLENCWISLTSEKVRFGLKDKIRHIPISPMLAKVLPYTDISLILRLREIHLFGMAYLPDRTTKVYTHLESNKKLQLEEIALFNYEYKKKEALSR